MVGLVLSRKTPPSVLPDISPSRGEIGWGTVFATNKPCHAEVAPYNFATTASDLARAGDRQLPISPLEGEMPGRAEGGISCAGVPARARSFAARFGGLLTLLSLLLAPISAHAVNPDEILADPVLEERARALSAQLRCMVCQNQSIDDSNAELARDLRLLVRERIVAGESDEKVIDYVVSRYGEFVLLKPRLSVRTYVLWSAPVVLFLIGGGVMLAFSRKRQAVGATAKLSPEEEAKLKELLGE